MPPKSKAKAHNKDDEKGLAKSDKNPSAKDKTMADKGKKKIGEQISFTKENVQEHLIGLRSTSDQFKLGRNSEQTTDRKKSLIEEDSGPKKKQESIVDPVRRMLDQLALEGSSSEGEVDDDTAYYNQKLQKSFVADADMLLAGTPSNPEPEDAEKAEEEIGAVALGDESSDEDMPEYLKQEELEEEADFFGKIADVPDVEKLSEDLSVDKLKITEKPKPKEKPVVEGDIGKFVDPLTGEVLKVKEPTVEKEIIIVAVKKPKPVVDAPVMAGGRVLIEVKVLPPASDDEVSIDILSDQEKEDAPATKDEEDTFNQFLTLEATGPLVDLEEIDVEALFREENARAIRIAAYEFVEYLINMAVEKSEYLDQAVMLRQNLDKRKLMKELKEKLHVLEAERRSKQFLNRKCVEYFRRKRTFRPIQEDNPKTMHIEYRKYQAAMTTLDHWLIKEEEAKTISKINLEVTRAQLIVESARSQEKVKELEGLMSKTLKREHFDKLEQVVTRALNQMELNRKEISDVRFQLIQKQHNRATLVEQLSNLEDLGNGLNMRDFENVQTEVQALDKKIEERNAELNKLRLRSQGDINRMAHMREKQSMLRENIGQRRQYMDQLQLEKQNLREFLHKLKIDRNRLRKEMRDTSFQSGLLDKPVLMKDYDTTIECLAVLKSRIEDSQATIKTLNAKIKIMEQHYNNE